MSDLTSAFNGLGLSPNTSPPRRYHTLNITFPVLSLLPHDTAPFFYPPKDLRFRQRPRLGRYHLKASDLSFWHRIVAKETIGLPTITFHKTSLQPPEFLALISSIESSAGHSTLEIASFESENFTQGSGIQHIFRLTTARDESPHNTPHTTLHTCQIPADHLETLFEKSAPSTEPNSQRTPHPWLPLISNIIHRASDRAYLHVIQNLQTGKKPAYRGEAARWARGWETCKPRSGSHLLASRLRCQLGPNNDNNNGGGGGGGGGGEGWVFLSQLDGENVAAYQNEQMTFCLPCGHRAVFALGSLRCFGDGESAGLKCFSCGGRVLGDRELGELALRVEGGERAAFEFSEGYFSDAVVSLPRAGPGGRGPVLRIPSGGLQRALRYALESLRVPESASPGSLSLVDFGETGAVLADLQLKADRAGEKAICLTPYALWEALMETGMGTLGVMYESGSGELPPCFVDFVGKWLTRTVNLLVADQGLVPCAEGASEELSSLMSTCQMN